MTRLFTALAIVTILLTGCGSKNVYSGYSEIDTHGWSYASPLEYVVTLPDSTANCCMLVNITHDNNYEYSNLWLEVKYTVHDIEHIDTVNIKMCDPLGNWRGKGMPGYYQLSDTLSAGPVTLTDSCSIRLRHIMRVDTLHGISQVGIELATR